MSSNSTDKTMSLVEIIISIIENVKFIIIITTFFALISIIYIFTTNPVYTSTSKIMSSSGGSDIFQNSSIVTQLGFNLPSNNSEPNWVYKEIIKSRTLALKVLTKKFDSHKFGKQKTLLSILTHGNEKPEFGIDTLNYIGTISFLNLIDVSEDRKTGIVTLSVSSNEPQLAAKINETIIRELDKHQQQYNKSKTSETRIFIQERILSIEKELKFAEENLKDFRERNRRIGNSPALQLEQERLSREVVVLTGVYTTLKQQLETTKIEEVKDSDYVIVFDKPDIPLLKSNPRTLNILILSIASGLLFSIFMSIVKDFILNNQKENIKELHNAKIKLYKNIKGIIPFLSPNK